MFWFVFFFYSLLLHSAVVPRCMLLLASLPTLPTVHSFFFVHLYYFFSFRRHISAAGSGYVLFIDVLHSAVFFLCLLLRTIATTYLRYCSILFYTSATAAIVHTHIRNIYMCVCVRVCVHVCSPRIIMCKKTQPIRSYARSPGISVVTAAVLFSSYHFQQVTNQVLCVAAVHGWSYYIQIMWKRPAHHISVISSRYTLYCNGITKNRNKKIKTQNKRLHTATDNEIRRDRQNANRQASARAEYSSASAGH